MKTFLKGLAIMLLIAVALGLSFFIIAGIYKLVCMAFGFEFTWLRGLAVWLIYTVICGIAKTRTQIES